MTICLVLCLLLREQIAPRSANDIELGRKVLLGLLELVTGDSLLKISGISYDVVIFVAGFCRDFPLLFNFCLLFYLLILAVCTQYVRACVRRTFFTFSLFAGFCYLLDCRWLSVSFIRAIELI